MTSLNVQSTRPLKEQLATKPCPYCTEPVSEHHVPFSSNGYTWPVYEDKGEYWAYFSCDDKIMSAKGDPQWEAAE